MSQTPHLDTLLAQATQGVLKAESTEDDEHYIYRDLQNAGKDAISVLFVSDWGTAEDARKLALFATHGPAIVAVLKMVPVIIDHDPNAPFCHANQLRQECLNLLTLLDQEAKG